MAVSTITTYKTLSSWLSGCENEDQIQLCADAAYEFLLCRDHAEHEYNLIQQQAAEKRTELQEKAIQKAQPQYSDYTR